MRSKWLFWVLLGMFSTLFAEVITGSFPFVLFNPAGWLIVFPVYFLHMMVLWYLVYARGIPSFSTLFLGGALFGMYEAYITKVIWTGWGDDTALVFGGVAVLETLVLVLFVHALLGFILPLVLAQYALTKSSRKMKGGLGVALFLGVYHGGTATSPGIAILSGVLLVALLFLLVGLGRKFVHPTLQEALPSRKTWWVFVVFLILLYLIMGAKFNGEGLPGIAAQATVWGIYAVLVVLFVRNLKKSTKNESAGRFSWKCLIAYGGAFLGASIIVSFLGVKPIVGIAVLIVGIILGLTWLVKAVKSSW